MSTYGQVLWLPICAGLTAVGVLISVLLWRKRGAASGLRLVSWSLLPIALYLIGLLPVVVRFGVNLFGWVTKAAFSLTAWVGVAVLGLAVLLWVVSGVMLGRRRAAREREDSEEASDGAEAADASNGKELTTGKERSQGAGGEDFSDIEDILKRRGIE